MLTWKTERRDVFVCFDNDQKAAAPRDARRLIEITDLFRVRYYFCRVAGALGFTVTCLPERLAATASIRVRAASRTSP